MSSLKPSKADEVARKCDRQAELDARLEQVLGIHEARTRELIATLKEVAKPKPVSE